MENIENYVLLAEASYADFSGINFKLASDTDSAKNLDEIKQAIDHKKGNPDKKMAEYIADKYTVVAHFTDADKNSWLNPFKIAEVVSNDASGFSATLFQDRDTGEYVFAIKGTFSGYDAFVVDIGDIANDGLAHHQIVDMYNFWQSIVQEEFKPAAPQQTFQAA